MFTPLSAIEQQVGGGVAARELVRRARRDLAPQLIELRHALLAAALLHTMRAVFLLLALVAAASGLQLAAAPRPAAAVATRRAAPLMAMPTIDDAKNLSDDELNQEIVNAQKVRCDRLAGASPPRRPRFAPGVARGRLSGGGASPAAPPPQLRAFPPSHDRSPSPRRSCSSSARRSRRGRTSNRTSSSTRSTASRSCRAC